MRLPNFFKTNEKEIFDEVYRILPVLRDILEKEGMDFLVEYCYEHVDMVLKHAGVAEQAKSCSTGCSWCCHDFISVSKFEQEYIRKRIKEHKIKPDRRRSKLQNNSKDEKLLDLKFADRACVFLSSTDGRGKCNIYEIRPLLCRTHNSVMESIKCNKEVYPNGFVTEGRIIETEAVGIALALLAMKGEFELFPIHKIF